MYCDNRYEESDIEFRQARRVVIVAAVITILSLLVPVVGEFFF